MAQKVEFKEFEQLKTVMKGIATLDDLKKLYKKVNPALKSSEEQMVAFTSEMMQFREVIKHNDALMAYKANKQTFLDYEKTVEQTYAKLNIVEKMREEQDERIGSNEEEIDKVKQMIDLLQQNVRTEIFTAVKRVQSKMQPTASKESKQTIILSQVNDDKGYRCGSNSPKNKMVSSCSKLVGMQIPQNFETQDILKVLALKAEKTEVEDLRKNKTNKDDSDNQMKAIDIIHKQLTHTVVLLIEILKSLINETIDTPAVRQGKRMQVMDHLINVLNWIHDFEPQQVTYDHLMLPENLRALHEFQKTATVEMSRTLKSRATTRPSLESVNFRTLQTEKSVRFPASRNGEISTI